MLDLPEALTEMLLEFSKYFDHYHGERNHQGVGNRLIDSKADGRIPRK